MRRNLVASQKGMSLVEATMILAVMALLTSVISPSIGDYIGDARHTKAKADAEVIGTAILRQVWDTGLGCLSTTPTTSATACTKANRVDLLLSTGNSPTATGTDYAAPGGTNSAAAANNNWMNGTTPVGSGNRSTTYAQFVSNSAGYTSVSFATGGGPKRVFGWRGAYMQEPVGPDPWGWSYQSNTMFLQPASDASSGTTNGLLNGGWINDVIVISAGPDGNVGTKFGDNTTGATTVTGDDIVYVVAGSSR